MTAVTTTLRTKAQIRLFDLVERVSWTFVQGGIAALPTAIALVGDGHAHTHSGEAAIAAALTGGVAAVLSLLKNLVTTAQAAATGATNITLRFLWTFLFAAFGAIPGTIYLELDFAKGAAYAAITAGVAAVISLAKNVTATNVEANASAGFQPGVRT